MNIIQRIQDGNTSRRIERAVQCENRLKELSNIAVHRRVVYDSTRSKYLTGISTIDTQEQMDKGGENAQYLSFLRGRILDKLSAVEKDYRNETLKNTKEALEIKGQLIKLYSYEGIEKSTKDTLNQDRIGAAYETVLEAFKQKKIDKEKLKEVRKQVESKLNKQVAYSDMIVMDALGRVLLLKRSEGDGQFDGKWGLPGGHVDPDETHLEAGVRELAEESIISVTPETCSKVAELNNDKAHIEYFRTYVDYIPIVGINAREHSDYEWVDPVNLTKYDLIGDLEKTLKEVFKYVLDPKVVEVKKAFNTILTAYFIGKVDEDTISKVSEIYLEKAEKNKGEKKVGKVMREYKEGTLHSGSGEKVTSREQAIAIALSEARKIQKSDETQTEEVNVEKGKKVKDLAKKYHEWNTQGGEPAYKKPSEASVLEFLQNNYEDLSEDDETKKGLLNELNTTSLSKAISTIMDGLKGNVIEYDLIKAKVRKYIKKEADGKGGFIYVYKQDRLQSDNLNIKLIQEYGEKIIKGEISIKRLLPEEERGRIKGGRRNVEATIVLGTGKKTNQGVYARSEQLEQLKQYAKQSNCWIEDYLKEFKENNRIETASESDVFYKDGFVFKINNFSQHDNIIDLFDRVSVHNVLFPSTFYEIVGFTERDGQVNVIMKQPFIEMQRDSEDNIVTPSKPSMMENMRGRGFKYVGDNRFVDKNYIVEDIHSKNICLSKDGSLLYIDPIIRINTKKEGFGGDRVLGAIDLPNLKNGLKKGIDINNEGKINKGQEYVERLSPEEERGCIEGGRRNVEATILCSTVKGSDSEKREDVERMGKGKVQIRKALEILELAYQQGQIPLDVLEKARHGVYADNAQNRELHRVGQPYGKEGEEDDKSGKEGKAKVVNADDKKQKDQPQSLLDQAKQASGSALEQASKEAKDPEVRTAAHQELKRRENEEQVQEGDEQKEGKEKGQLPSEILSDFYKKKFYEDSIKQIPGSVRDKYDLKNFTTKTLPLKDIKPSQEGEDYKNASSEEESKQIKKLIEGKVDVANVRKEDLYPILVDSDTHEIIDGNHRHAAYGMAGIKNIEVVLLKKKKDNKVEKSVQNDTWERWL